MKDENIAKSFEIKIINLLNKKNNLTKKVKKLINTKLSKLLFLHEDSTNLAI